MLLENKRVYLSSPMEYVKDSSWRTNVKNILKNKFKLKVFDPYDDPKQDIAKQIEELKSEGRYDELRSIVKLFVRKDLTIVDHSDIVIANVPYRVPTTGVVHEIINANNAKKITLLVEGTDKRKVSSWYFGFIPSRFIFGKWDELYDFLDNVNNDPYNEDDRFYFLNNYPSEWLN